MSHRPPTLELIREIKLEDEKFDRMEKGLNPPPTPKTKNSIDNEWSIGCLGKLDRRCVVYFSQIMILGICIGVSLYQVSTMNENKDFWVGLLSTSIGVLIPNPKLSKKE